MALDRGITHIVTNTWTERSEIPLVVRGPGSQQFCSSSAEPEKIEPRECGRHLDSTSAVDIPQGLNPRILYISNAGMGICQSNATIYFFSAFSNHPLNDLGFAFSSLESIVEVRDRFLGVLGR